MPDQNRNQQGKRNRHKQSSQQGSERRDNRDNSQQTQGNQDEPFRDDEVEEIGSTDRNRSNREPASIANDRSRGSDRLRRDGEEGQLDELEGDIENETDMDDVDEDILGGRSNR
jgi:hypothetical protein